MSTTTAASAVAEKLEELKNAAPPTATDSPQPPAEVPPAEEQKPPEEKPIAGEQVEESEPDLETVPESSGDFSKYKPLFKDYPELRAILGREQAFSEIAPSFSEFREIMQRIPSVADAEQLVADAENKRAFGETFREDVPSFVENLKASDGLAFGEFVKQFPDALAQHDESLWVQQATHYTGRVLSNVHAIARNTGDEELLKAAQLVSQSLGIPAGLPAAPSQPRSSEAQKLREQLAERDRADQEAAFQNFWSQTDEAIISASTEEIDRTLKAALPAASQQQLDRMKREVWEKTLEAINAQPQTRAQIEQFRSNAMKGRMGIADHKAIVDYSTKRARLVIPKVAKSVITEWSTEVLRIRKEETEKKQGIAQNTRDAGTGPQGTSSAAASPPPVKGQPRGVDAIFKEIKAGTYVAPRPA